MRGNGVTAATTTSAKPAAKTAGLYTVPLGSNDTLKKGVAKLQFKISPLLSKAAEYVFNSLGFWDKFAVPRAMAALKAKGVTNIRFPSGNFIADSNGNLKPATLLTPALKAKGYLWYARKGYDPKTGIAFVWVVVS